MSRAELREAASLIVVRDAASNGGSVMEVLMLRRRAGSSFTGGAHVFPGGALEPADRDPAATSLSAGHDDSVASRLLGVDTGGLGYYVAAIRECFEEAGLLFAEGAGDLVSYTDPETRLRFGRHRSSLNAGDTSLAAICRSEGLLLAVDRLRYFSHWITPLGAPRRYDTRFFLVLAPQAQVALHDDGEVVASEWIVPSEALARHRAGELDLMFPTVKHLESLCLFTAAREMLDAAPSEVPSIQPRISADGRGFRILLPGDPGFDEATGLPDGTTFPDRPSGFPDRPSGFPDRPSGVGDG